MDEKERLFYNSLSFFDHNLENSSPNLTQGSLLVKIPRDTIGIVWN